MRERPFKVTYIPVPQAKKRVKIIRTISRAIERESHSKGSPKLLLALKKSLHKLKRSGPRCSPPLNSHEESKVKSSPTENSLGVKPVTSPIASPLVPQPYPELGQSIEITSPPTTFVPSDSCQSTYLISLHVTNAHCLSELPIVTMETEPNGGLEPPVIGLLLENQIASQNEDQVSAGTGEGFKIYPLTNQCHHYTRRKDVEYDIQKYWDQRHTIFSLYDEGIHMTDESWFGVTPEPVAQQVAADLVELISPEKTILIDMFAGAGGNVIAFAQQAERWTKIIAIEKDKGVLACAQHNATVYEVQHLITWVHGDSFEYLETNASKLNASKMVVFASPPWGGPGYMSDAVFDLSKMEPYSLKMIHNACKKMDSAIYLPRTSDMRQIARLVPDGEKIEVVQYCVAGASKALVAYIPAFEDIKMS